MNYQNIPRKDKVVKRAFRSKFEDGVLSFFDFGQIEARLAAMFMSQLGWDGLRQDILRGVDVHRRMAGIIYGVPESEVTEEMRDRAKTGFFGMIYGARAKRFAEILNASGPGSWIERMGKPIKQNEARLVVDAFRDAMPGLELLSEACERRAKSRGYIETPWGRQLKPEEYGEHKIPNALIQGTAADLMKQALLNVGRWKAAHPRYKSHPVSVIHDEIIFDGPKSELPILAREIPPLMDDERISKYIPVVVEVEFSDESWADKEEFHGV